MPEKPDKPEKPEHPVAPPEEKGPFIVLVDDTADNHYFVGPFKDRDAAVEFENEVSNVAGMGATTSIVKQVEEDYVLEQFAATAVPALEIDPETGEVLNEEERTRALR